MATASSSSSASRSGASQAGLPKDAPLPSASIPWSFGCKCLNVRIDGRRLDVNGSEDRNGKGRVMVWIGEGDEHIKHPAYVSYDQDPIARRGSLNPQGFDMDILGPSWRTCWICETKLYNVSGKARADPGVKNAWVEMDPTNVLSGKALDEAANLPSLPFSGLSLELPSSSSNFGRQPSDRPPSIYSPVSPSSSHSPRLTTLIPPLHDPFFLPPPFIPAHPHLRDLCNAAVNHLVERHTQLENEVKQFISDKAQEMRELEEKVRAEVEVLWDKYKVGPGAGEDLERKRSRSTSKEIPTSPPREPPNPILREASLQSPNHGSLLSASISANQMFAPPPPPVADAVDDSIHEAAKTFGKDLDQRAVAMSYVFSALDETMANQAKREVRRGSRRKSVEKREAEEGVPEDTKGKDSWIEQERLTAASVLREKAAEDEEVMDGTPRAAISKGLEERRGSKGKEKGRVTFEELPPVDENAALKGIGVQDEPVESVEDDGEAKFTLGAEADYVFDFELDNAAPHSEGSTDDSQVRRASTDISRTRNIVEANLSTTFAADAPSHRAAWRKMQEKAPLYASIRRRESTDSLDTDDSGQISKLATSVPVSIALPARRVVSGFQLERKTSLSDRTGILVPPLKAAMREQGVVRQGRPLAAAAEAGRRSASVSRERDAAKSFRADPGAVFESLADDVDDEDEEEDGLEEDGGTLRESKTFMPPHILARNASRDAGDVGWRSMVDG